MATIKLNIFNDAKNKFSLIKNKKNVKTDIHDILLFVFFTLF